MLRRLRAVTASEAQDHRTAADLYAQLYQQVPGGFTPALRRQGGDQCE
jgi:hypothetical protein